MAVSHGTVSGGPIGSQPVAFQPGRARLDLMALSRTAGDRAPAAFSYPLKTEDGRCLCSTTVIPSIEVG